MRPFAVVRLHTQWLSTPQAPADRVAETHRFLGTVGVSVVDGICEWIDQRFGKTTADQVDGVCQAHGRDLHGEREPGTTRLDR